MTTPRSFWNRLNPIPDEHGQAEAPRGSQSETKLIFIYENPEETSHSPSSHESWITEAEREAGHSEAIAVVDDRLETLAREEGVSAKARLRALAVAETILVQDAIPPYVSWDAAEEEIKFFWVAGQIRIEISIPDEGSIYVRATGNPAQPSISGFYSHPPERAVRQHIALLSRIVRVNNPNWRALLSDS